MCAHQKTGPHPSCGHGSDGWCFCLPIVAAYSIKAPAICVFDDCDTKIYPGCSAPPKDEQKQIAIGKEIGHELIPDISSITARMLEKKNKSTRFATTH